MEDEKKNQVSARLGTIIIIVVILIIMLGIAIVILNKKENIDNTVTGNNLTQNSINDENQTMTPGVVTGNDIVDKSELTMNFLKLENEEKNLIYSPLSIKYALNMLNEGAEGNTKKQIEKLLGNTNLTQYENKENVLSLANTIYIRDMYKQNIKTEYMDTLIRKYKAEVQYDAFKDAQNVNRWIEQKTLGIIKNMIKDEIVQDPYTKMLLINALAIDMEWKLKFDTGETSGEEFYLADGSTMQATMMHKKTSSDDIAYYKNDEVTALTMDLKQYDDTQLEFIAIMPEKESLPEYVKKVTLEDINKITSQVTSASKTKAGVRVTIPKFAYNYDMKLKENLKQLGMTDAFDKDFADLSKMADSMTNFYVGDALHKADIEFSEEGIKAAAVTVFVGKEDNAIIEPDELEEVIMNKPFLYIIRDKNTKEVWFVGTLYEPNSWENDKAEYSKQPF